MALFNCRDEACGGDNSTAIYGGGGSQSMMMRLYSHAELRAPYKRNGYCAIMSDISRLRYAAMRLPTPNGDAHFAIATYSLRDELYCKALNERTVVVVTIIEPKAREQRMVTVGVPEPRRPHRAPQYPVRLRQSRYQAGKQAQIEQIARLMQASPNERLQVVGHTDGQGQVAYNMDLSRRRAQSVVQMLVQTHSIAVARLTGHGVGPLALVAPNNDAAGRARNRRTELVPQ